MTLKRDRPKTLELLIKRGIKIDYNKKDFRYEAKGEMNGDMVADSVVQFRCIKPYYIIIILIYI